jgi:NAD(P)-dependent dehydrogenase (short-subunit alcohol dehydrogenase family)
MQPQDTSKNVVGEVTGGGMEINLSGQLAVVTGAAQGNGAAIAAGLAAAGASLLLCDLNGDGAEEKAAQIRASGRQAQGFSLDVTDAQACASFASHVAETNGAVSILINNAGIIRRRAPDEGDFLEVLNTQVDVNLKGTANMVVACLEQLKETKGRIVNIASIASFVSYKNSASYSASKGAVAQLTRGLANDLAKDGVRVNGIAPGVIATPMTEITRADANALAPFLNHTPMGRVGQPGELVGPVLFLTSDLSSYVTGAIIPVDGGYLTI